ncbi:MAG: glycosyltransferase [Hymenobacter sp.]|nr:MAG: glycosyltransferase [Hymenobacter sp.]
MIYKTINVFVHLAANKDAAAWRKAWMSGTLVGINDETPYGYGRAKGMGCVVKFSESHCEGFLVKIIRLGLRVITGFDVIHAFRQRDNLTKADVIWTHTEAQFLAVAAILCISKRKPKLIGQSVWLFDSWKKLTPLHKFFYRRLINHVDILTVHSSDNLDVARSLFPNKRIVLVPFGIPSENMIPPIVRDGKIFRILSIGNDRHRDWTCLACAIDGLTNATAVILSKSAPRYLANERQNLQVMEAQTNDELLMHLAEANVVCVSLKPNRHASGITVIQEAVLAGVPVVATDTGGLKDYFSSDTIRYVPPEDYKALREALREIAIHPKEAQMRAIKAQQRMVESNIGAESFIRRHVELSREIIES